MSMERGAERLLKYIHNFKKAFETAKKNLNAKDERIKEIMNIIESYLKDSEYFYNINDVETGLITIAYAEGLLDALRLLGYTKFEWLKKEDIPNVVVGGTFDIIHPGHIEFIKEASKYGKVHVIVARDTNVKKSKGKVPINDENHRLKVISSLKYVYKAVLGDENDFLKPVLMIKPKYVVLGPDQPFDEKLLEDELSKRGLKCKVVRVKEKFNVGTASTSEIVKKIIKAYCH